MGFAQAYFFSQKYDKSLVIYQRLLQENDTHILRVYIIQVYVMEYLHNLDSAKVYLLSHRIRFQKIQEECIVQHFAGEKV